MWNVWQVDNLDSGFPVFFLHQEPEIPSKRSGPYYLILLRFCFLVLVPLISLPQQLPLWIIWTHSEADAPSAILYFCDKRKMSLVYVTGVSKIMKTKNEVGSIFVDMIRRIVPNNIPEPTDSRHSISPNRSNIRRNTLWPIESDNWKPEGKKA